MIIPYKNNNNQFFNGFMMSNILAEDKVINTQIMENISNCINDKMAILNVKLPDIAKRADVDYFTLRKIVNKEEDYLPNLRIIIKIAHFLNIKVGDILNYARLPQYVPIIAKDVIYNFLASNVDHSGFNNTIFCEQYIHKKAFAVIEKYKILFKDHHVTYVCYPSTTQLINIDQIYLFKNYRDDSVELIFARVLSIDKNGLITVLTDNTNVELVKYEVLAIVVEVKMNENVL